MTHCTRSIISGLALAVLGTGCGGGLRATSKLEGDWSAVKEGKEVALYADSKTCATKIGKTREELKSGGGTSLSDAPWSKSASAWDVKTSLVDDLGSTSPNLYLELEQPGTNQRIWLFSKESTTPDCVHPAISGLREANRSLGKSFSWAPWKQTCTEVVAGGPRFKTLIENSPDGAALPAESITLSESGALVNLASSSLLVAPATLQSCFAEAGSAEAKLPDSGALALLRVSPERCESERAGNATHIACRSTVGAWKRQESGLVGVRRTLGPVHFLEGKPISGRRFARAVVAIDTGTASSAREGTLYAAIRSAASELISRGDDNVRIVPLGDPAVTSNVKIVVRDVTIGELQTKRSQQNSHYIVSQNTVANQEKSSARSQLEEAEQTLSSKRSECDSIPMSDYNASQACIDRCTAGGGMAAATCGFTCRDAGGNSGAKDECNANVDRAQSLLENARAAYQSMPDTITNTQYGDFAYERIDYSRKVSAVIQTDSGSNLAQKHATDPLEFEATDYQVVADSAHGVEGHSARRDFIDSPDSIVPSLAERATGIAIKRLREALSQGAIDAALRALAASGGSAKPGFEAVDAMAFDVVGKRLIKAERYGDSAGALPTSDVALGSGECVLAVAVSGDATTEVSLATQDGHFADQRKRPFASLELCAGEWTGPKPPATVMDGTQVHWAVYRTHETYR